MKHVETLDYTDEIEKEDILDETRTELNKLKKEIKKNRVKKTKEVKNSKEVEKEKLRTEYYHLLEKIKKLNKKYQYAVKDLKDPLLKAREVLAGQEWDYIDEYLNFLITLGYLSDNLDGQVMFYDNHNGKGENPYKLQYEKQNNSLNFHREKVKKLGAKYKGKRLKDIIVNSLDAITRCVNIKTEEIKNKKELLRIIHKLGEIKLD